MPLRNDDVDWDGWPVGDYLAENYRELHAADRAVIEHHCRVYSALPPDSVDRSLELGAGPNLYPLILASAACRRIEAVERSAAGVAYLRGQIEGDPDPSWAPFHALCRQLNPAVPATIRQALARVRVHRGDGRQVAPDSYGLVSMNFVAESVTEDRAEFEDLCEVYLRAARPGGHLVASFMENMGRYRIGQGPDWPGYPVSLEIVREVFAPHTVDLELTRIDADPDLPEYGYTGMIMMSARRA